MRRTAALYLAVFTLLARGRCKAHSPASPATANGRPNVCAVGNSLTSSRFRAQRVDPDQFDPTSQVSDACSSYGDLDTLNAGIHSYVRNLANNTDFFSYYRLNLYNKKCPFWNDDNGLCGNRACAVITLENEEDIPEIWRAHELSKLEGPKAQHPGRKQQKERPKPLMGQLGEGVGESCVVDYDDECDQRDYCVPEDESASAKGDYVSLVENPERFTGYSGEGAHQVWESIYRENCFSKPSASHSTPGRSAPLGFSNVQARAALELKQVMRDHDRQQAGTVGKSHEALEFEDDCIEKRVFYRVISGMHASISTHLCYDYLNQQTGEWGPNVTCYRDRLHNRADRVANLYFNFALVSRAVGKLRDYVQDYTFCTGDPIEDQRTKQMISNLASAIPPGHRLFDERIMFQDQTADGISLKEDFRNRFRNVSRVMDCVGCDKCRLWGKVQTNGFGTALKVLFEFGNGHEGDAKPLLRRTELVALINTLDKISSALKALEHFRAMVEAVDAGKSIEEAERSTRTLDTLQTPSIVPNFDDLEELDDFDDGPSTRHQPSISEAFWQELEVVWKAYKFVLRSWLEIPVKIPSIIGVELARLTDFWLGRPIRPRRFEIRFPTRDEL